MIIVSGLFYTHSIFIFHEYNCDRTFTLLFKRFLLNNISCYSTILNIVYYTSQEEEQEH